MIGQIEVECFRVSPPLPAPFPPPACLLLRLFIDRSATTVTEASHGRPFHMLPRFAPYLFHNVGWGQVRKGGAGSSATSLSNPAEVSYISALLKCVCVLIVVHPEVCFSNVAPESRGTYLHVAVYFLLKDVHSSFKRKKNWEVNIRRPRGAKCFHSLIMGRCNARVVAGFLRRSPEPPPPPHKCSCLAEAKYSLI